MDNKYKVYIHIFPNNKKYIGITCRNVYRRWRSGYGYKEQKHIWRAIQKYGWGNVKHEILFEDLTKEEACEKEIELIKLYKTTDDRYGYNRSTGGEVSSAGVICSEETRKKLSEKGKGRIFTKETKEKISKALKGNKNGVGRIISEKTKEKLRESKIGKPRDEKTIEKLKEKGREFWNNLDNETKKRIINENLKGPKIGHLVSEATKEKLRQASKGRKQSQETIEKRKQTMIEKKKNGYVQTNGNHKKKIICIETGEIFNSLKETEEKYKLTSLCHHLKGRQKTCKGKHYAYYENYVGDDVE